MKGEVVDRTPVVNDNESDNRYWMRNNSKWTFGVKELEKGELWSGYVKNVVGGDTVDVHFNTCEIQRVRLVGIDAPEIGEEGYKEAKAFVNRTCIGEEFKLGVDEISEEGYEEAKEFVSKTCLGEEFKLDVDDMKQYNSYYRILAVVYVN